MEWWTVVFEVCARQKLHLGKHLEAEFSLVRILSEISRPTDFRNSNFRSANAQIKRCYLRIQKKPGGSHERSSMSSEGNNRHSHGNSDGKFENYANLYL